jgi:hypothetical protein
MLHECDQVRDRGDAIVMGVCFEILECTTGSKARVAGNVDQVFRIDAEISVERVRCTDGQLTTPKSYVRAKLVVDRADNPEVSRSAIEGSSEAADVLSQPRQRKASQAALVEDVMHRDEDDDAAHDDTAHGREREHRAKSGEGDTQYHVAGPTHRLLW